MFLKFIFFAYFIFSSNLFQKAISGPALGKNDDKYIYNELPGLGAYGAYGMAY